MVLFYSFRFILPPLLSLQLHLPIYIVFAVGFFWGVGGWKVFVLFCLLIPDITWCMLYLLSETSPFSLLTSLASGLSPLGILECFTDLNYCLCGVSTTHFLFPPLAITCYCMPFPLPFLKSATNVMRSGAAFNSLLHLAEYPKQS